MSAPSAALVQSKAIASASLHRSIPKWQRLDVWPFVLLHAANLAAYKSLPEHHLACLIALLAILFVNGLVHLFTHWSVDAKCFISSRRVSDVRDAQFVKIVPTPHHGPKAIVPLQLLPQIDRPPLLHFVHQKRRYDFNEQVGRFEKLRFPVSGLLEDYQRHRGFDSPQAFERAIANYGPNRFIIPLPTFWEMFKEHAVAPFFVFQIFCVSLWFLDEYWYYSLFTLLMLFFFESTVVKSRLRNMQDLRSMCSPPYPVNVYRGGKWNKVKSDELLPGDLISIVRSAPGNTCPCDVLVLHGTAVADEALLTGESVPQWKESIGRRDGSEPFDMKRDKVHVLWGGTRIIQHSGEKGDGPLAEAAAASYAAIPKAPDGGCVGFVLRTGFNTSQGKLAPPRPAPPRPAGRRSLARPARASAPSLTPPQLMRTILCSTEPITANSFEALAFIFILLCFAVAAAWYVLQEGLKDVNRSRYKLVLNCTMIITSVVPPELPMELSLAVNNSLIALARLSVFCTEPFRIPFAGKVDTCCFDKTGTLTQDELIVKGFAGLGHGTDLEDPLACPPETHVVVAGCHSLVHLDSGLVGDPVEKAAFAAVRWSYTKSEVAVPKKGGPHRPGSYPTQVRIIQRYHFSSALKRMACLASVEGYAPKDGPRECLWALAKGAPETIGSLLASVPKGYDETHKHFSRLGYRVIALAYKTVPAMPASEARAMSRGEVESGLTFAGFVVFHCPLKADSGEAIRQLRESSHRVVMITGDHALTACQVASELGITSRPVLILSPVSGASPPRAEWVSVDEAVRVPAESKRAWELHSEFDLCASGEAMRLLAADPAVLNPYLPPRLPLSCCHAPAPASSSLLLTKRGGCGGAQGAVPAESYIPFVSVFARVSPDQKELVVTTMKSLGGFTLMCGDGTNDVGALKHAHVGVALIGHSYANSDSSASAAAKKLAAAPAALAPAAPAGNKDKEASGSLTRAGSPAPPRPAPPDAAGPQAAQGRPRRRGPRRKRRRRRAQLGPFTPPPPPKPVEQMGFMERLGYNVKVAQARALYDHKLRLIKAGKWRPGEPLPDPHAAMREAMAQMEAEGGEGPPVVRFGDASIASPFTSKLGSVISTCHIIRQGRCTLVTTYQMFTILALNCLISAYALSVLYLDGIKLGDKQATFSGMLIAMFFLFISWAKARPPAPARPPRERWIDA
eukprot:tig00000806_g4341.t1